MTDLVERCYEAGWTDGLPVVPPTPERVERMLGDLFDRRDEVIAVLEPSGGVATREKVAANAVMAGCLPQHLPIVETAVRAVAEPAFKLDRVLTTASSQTPVVLVNGPLAVTVGLDGGWEALGSRARANATIGRALMLVLRNIASLAVGGLDHATLGHPGKYSYCFTENVELSPWPTWHVQRGLDPEGTHVTVYAAEAPLCVVDMGHDAPETILDTIAASLAVPGTYNAYFREDLWLVLAPQHARALADAGWDRRSVAAYLYERARVPAGVLRGHGLYGYLDDLVPPFWLDGAPDDEPIAIVDGPERIALLVAGGLFGGYTAALFGEGDSVTVTVTP